MNIIIIIRPFRSQFGLKLRGRGLSPGPAIAVGYTCPPSGQVLQNQLLHPVAMDSGLCGGWRYPPYLQFEFNLHCILLCLIY